jgi:DNA-binding NarL/FixJ family response regulator
VRLVLGDDHLLFIEALAVALDRRGMTVAALATSPEEVVSAVARHQPDVCLLDAFFPGSSGLDAVRVIRLRYPHVKIVMLSASSDAGVVSAAIEDGVAGFIRKDQHVADIARTLTRVWAGERVFDPDLLRAVVGSFDRPAAAHGDWLLDLTLREQEVLMRMMDGECTKQIACSLAIAPSTARTHVRNVLVKLGVHSRLEATTKVTQAGLVGWSGQYGAWAQVATGGG